MTKRTISHFSPRATLCVLGTKIRTLKLFDTLAAHLRIKQKTVKHTPLEKLCDAFIAILAGAHGLYEINTRLRADTALQRALGDKPVPNSRWSKKLLMPARLTM